MCKRRTILNASILAITLLAFCVTDARAQVSHLTLSEALEMTTTRNIDWLDKIRFTEDENSSRITDAQLPSSPSISTTIPTTVDEPDFGLVAYRTDCACSQCQQERAEAPIGHAPLVYNMPVEIRFHDDPSMPIEQKTSGPEQAGFCLADEPLRVAASTPDQVCYSRTRLANTQEMDIPTLAMMLHVSLLGTKDSEMSRSLIEKSLAYVAKHKHRQEGLQQQPSEKVRRQLSQLENENRELKRQLNENRQMRRTLQTIQANVERNFQQLCMMSTDASKIEQGVATIREQNRHRTIQLTNPSEPRKLVPVQVIKPVHPNEQEIRKLRAELENIRARLEQLDSQTDVLPAGLLEPVTPRRSNHGTTYRLQPLPTYRTTK